jgi:hypothetical protein
MRLTQSPLRATAALECLHLRGERANTLAESLFRLRAMACSEEVRAAREHVTPRSALRRRQLLEVTWKLPFVILSARIHGGPPRSEAYLLRVAAPNLCRRVRKMRHAGFVFTARGL